MTSGLWAEIGKGIYESLYMTLISTGVAYMVGLPLGVLLLITRKGGLRAAPLLNQALGGIVNLLRSVPFLILMMALTQVTRFVMGKSYGSFATILPLTIATFPFVSRMVESALAEVDAGMIEAAQSMGAGLLQIIVKVLVPEATPALVNGAAITTTSVLGYSAMAGAIGGGGLGAIAINYGYHRFNLPVMLVCVAIMVVLVQLIQLVGSRMSLALDHRIR